MDIRAWQRISPNTWRLAPTGEMRVPACIFADDALIAEMDDKVAEQIRNVAGLPGIVQAAYAMPDAHWGYGFPIGGVAAFDPEAGGIVCAGGVGFDISCGVRNLLTDLTRADIEAVKLSLAESLFRQIPAGLGSQGKLSLDPGEMEAMLEGGARWAVARGHGLAEDLERIEEGGAMAGAVPDAVSDRAKFRQRLEMGTLGSGNHYLEVQEVVEIVDPEAAAVFGLRLGGIVVSIHCGSRGLGHQIATDYQREMAIAMPQLGISVPDLDLACAPIRSELGARYLGAMRAGINCALANREIITHLTRRVFAHFFPGETLDLLFDVSHNTCKEEEHRVRGGTRTLFVHRKGATRALGPGHAELPPALRAVGQPVFIGGSMGTHSAIMAGTASSENQAFASACHGAGRQMSRHQALRQWHGREVVDNLAAAGIVIRSPSLRGVAEEAPGAYKDIGAVVEAAHLAGLARKVAMLAPVICIKG
jgi:tRNA-splicing ligase RtcB (3'-phosphate/5'-hydroxy nucleic acid ligase)